MPIMSPLYISALRATVASHEWRFALATRTTLAKATGYDKPMPFAQAKDIRFLDNMFEWLGEDEKSIFVSSVIATAHKARLPVSVGRALYEAGQYSVVKVVGESAAFYLFKVYAVSRCDEFLSFVTGQGHSEQSLALFRYYQSFSSAFSL